MPNSVCQWTLLLPPLRCPKDDENRRTCLFSSVSSCFQAVPVNSEESRHCKQIPQHCLGKMEHQDLSDDQGLTPNKSSPNGDDPSLIRLMQDAFKVYFPFLLPAIASSVYDFPQAEMSVVLVDSSWGCSRRCTAESSRQQYIRQCHNMLPGMRCYAVVLCRRQHAAVTCSLGGGTSCSCLMTFSRAYSGTSRTPGSRPSQ